MLGVLDRQVGDLDRRIADLEALWAELVALKAQADRLPKDDTFYCSVIEHATLSQQT